VLQPTTACIGADLNGEILLPESDRLSLQKKTHADPLRPKLLEMLDFATPIDSSCVAVRSPLVRI